jgi:small GTP-binding protein
MTDKIQANNAIKVILVGDISTGKTNLISVAAGLEFNTDTISTTSCSFMQKKIIINKKEYKVNLWDTIGQEKYRSLTKIFVKDSQIVIFVYDITNRESFESLPYWKGIIDDILGQDITLGVIGNKIDLYLEEMVKANEGKEFADSIGAKFKVTSAKDNPKEVSDFIYTMVDAYLKKNKNETRRDTLKIKKMKDNKKKEGCC